MLNPAAEKESKDAIPSILESLLEFDPAENVIKSQFWNEAFSAPPQGEEREKQLAAFLATLGCSSDGAPYVARGLIRNIQFRSTGSHVEVVADRLYKGKSDPTACPGVKGFTDEDWTNVSKLSPDSAKKSGSMSGADARDLAEQ